MFQSKLSALVGLVESFQAKRALANACGVELRRVFTFSKSVPAWAGCCRCHSRGRRRSAVLIPLSAAENSACAWPPSSLDAMLSAVRRNFGLQGHLAASSAARRSFKHCGCAISGTGLVGGWHNGPCRAPSGNFRRSRVGCMHKLTNRVASSCA